MKIEIDVELLHAIPFIVVLLAVSVELEPIKLVDICSTSILLLPFSPSCLHFY